MRYWSALSVCLLVLCVAGPNLTDARKHHSRQHASDQTKSKLTPGHEAATPALLAISSKHHQRVQTHHKSLVKANRVYLAHCFVSPDDADAGTANSLSVLLKGTDAEMSSAVLFAPSLNRGKVRQAWINVTDLGTLTSAALSLGATVAGDGANIELVSFDMYPGQKESPSLLKYANFANVGTAAARTSLAAGGDLEMTPQADYVVIVRTSNYKFAAVAGNTVAIRFLGADGDSTKHTLATGFAIGESTVFHLEHTAPLITQIQSIELSVDYTNDDTWMWELIYVCTKYQRLMFRNVKHTTIGFRPATVTPSYPVTY